MRAAQARFRFLGALTIVLRIKKLQKVDAIKDRQVMAVEVMRYWTTTFAGKGVEGKTSGVHGDA
jgi:hypothetical protein